MRHNERQISECQHSSAPNNEIHFRTTKLYPTTNVVSLCAVVMSDIVLGLSSMESGWSFASGSVQHSSAGPWSVADVI